MGKSSSSCFKIISCGSNSGAVDNGDEIESAERKAFADKRGWSFRKKSDRQRVLSNTASSEQSPSTGNKESPEAASVSFESLTNSTLPGKIQVASSDEKQPTLSLTNTNLKAEDNLVAVENISNIDSGPQESVIVVIQTAVRGYLAQKEFLKLKSIIKLQAIVRGHLVRRQAVGTLRCVQAIIKMQALVRARHARLLKERLAVEGKLDGNMADSLRLKPLVKEESGITKKYVFSNGFARKLLGSAPKEKPIHINCDPSKPSSAWNWLERWMAASSEGIAHTGTPKVIPEYEEQEENTELSASEVGAEDLFEFVPGPGHLKPSTEITVNDEVKSFGFQLGDEENSTSIRADGSDLPACQPKTVSKKISSSTSDDLEQDQIEEARTGLAQENRVEIRDALKSTLDSLSNETGKPLDTTCGTDSVSDKAEGERVNTSGIVETGARKQLETESKKSVSGSRKTCNPAFAAVQSKFEELSSKTSLGRPVSSSNHEVAVESRMDNNSKYLSLMDDSLSHEPRPQIGGSECGTEISISSTLDSPVRSETGEEFVREITGAENENSYPINLTEVFPSHDPDIETKNPSALSGMLSNSSDHVRVQLEKPEGIDGNSGNLDVDSIKAPQLPVEQRVSDMQIPVDSSTDRQVYKSSPDGSPRSHITGPESHGTPSSQISSKTQSSSKATQKRRSESAGKRPPSSQNNDSGGRSSAEHLPKDSKNGRRRKSFGVSRPDHVDHEQPRGSGNHLPNYMQATESAKAKAHSISPKMSPDVQDKDVMVKKMHSLPGNGKESSPRMQRSQSQAQQCAKGNGSYSPHGATERKWVR